RDRARAEERRPLPRAPERLVIALRARERIDDRPAAPFGAEPEIDAEAIAVFRHVAEDPGAAGRDARVELVHRDVAAGYGGVVGLVEEDDVDVAAKVQLLPSELAHPEDDERHDALRAAHGDARQPDLLFRAPERCAEGG